MRANVGYIRGVHLTSFSSTPVSNPLVEAKARTSFTTTSCPTYRICLITSLLSTVVCARMASLISVSAPVVSFLIVTLYNNIDCKIEFAQGKVDPHEAGKQGGHASGGSGDSGSTGSGNSGGSAQGRKFESTFSLTHADFVQNLPMARSTPLKLERREATLK